MLDNLFDLVKGLAGDAVINNPDVPNEHNNEVVAEATNTVASGLQNMVAVYKISFLYLEVAETNRMVIKVSSTIPL